MNKSKIIYKINKSVKQSLINHDKSLGKIIVIALSGGADSLTMLYSLYSIKKQYDLKLHIAHFNHNQRGKESLNDIFLKFNPDKVSENHADFIKALKDF